MRASLATILCSCLCVSAAPAQRLAPDGAAQTFHAYTVQYFDDYFRANPTAGTSAGFHEYDSKLEDYSAAATAAQIASLHAFEKKLSALDPAALDSPDSCDILPLLNSIRSQLLSLEVSRNQAKNPG